VAIQWGPVSDVGAVFDALRSHNIESIAGTLPQPVSSYMATLDQVLCQPYAVSSCVFPAESARAKFGRASSTASLRDVIARILGEFW